jgi:hypothetical protein
MLDVVAKVDPVITRIDCELPLADHMQLPRTSPR